MIDRVRDRESQATRSLSARRPGAAGVDAACVGQRGLGRSQLSRELALRVSNCRGPVLECGTGLTTILAGVLAERRGVTVYRLEQDSAWAELVERALTKYRIRQVQVKHAPLQPYDDYVCYDQTAMLDFPKWFELVLCDGPAVLEQWGATVHGQWRYGVLPALGARLVGAGEILFEDAEEPRAEKLLRRWQEEFRTSYRLIHSADGVCAIVSVRG